MQPHDKQRLLRFVSRCDTVDELVDTFSRLIDEDTLFIATRSTQEVGLRRRFAITLRDGTPMLRGDATVEESPALLSGPGSPAGIRLRILKLTPESIALHRQLLERKREREVTLVEPMPLPPPDAPDPPDPVAARERRARTEPGAGPVVPPPSSGRPAVRVPPGPLPPRLPVTPGATPAPVTIMPRPRKLALVPASGDQSMAPEAAPLSPPPLAPSSATHQVFDEVTVRATPTLPALLLSRGIAADAAAAAERAPQEPAPARPAEERAPPAESILPANPLSEMEDGQLRELIECALFEEVLPSRDRSDDLVTPRPILVAPIAPAAERAGAIAPVAGDTAPTREPLEPESGRAGAPAPAPAPVGDDARAPVPEPVRAGVLSPAPEPTLAYQPAGPARAAGGRFVAWLFGVAIGVGAGYVLFGTDLVLSRSQSPGGAEEPPAAAVTHVAAAGVEERPAPVAPAGLAAPGGPPTALVADAGPTTLTDGGPAAAAAAAPDAGPAVACTASIDTSPADATVLIDDREVGVGSLVDQAVPCHQPITIVVRSPNHRSFKRTVTATAGTPLEVAAHLAPEVRAPPPARLLIKSDPPGAIITLDGKVIGRAPMRVSVRKRSVFVTASLKDYKVWTRQVRVTRGKVMVQARLDAVSGGAARKPPDGGARSAR